MARSFNRKPLIILDINGLLCCKRELTPSPLSLTPSPLSLTPILKTEYYEVFARPHAKEFLSTMFRLYTVSFFTATTYSNAHKILAAILTKNQLERCLFTWYRNQTREDTEGVESYATVKKLEDVFSYPKIKKLGYDYTNTLIIDDSESKMRYNPSKNVVICKPFTTVSPKCYLDDYLPTLIHEIASRFAEL